MAASMHEDIRLDIDLIGNLPLNTYGVMAEGLEDVCAPAVATDRGITGKLHVHRLMDGADPEVFRDYHYVLILTRAELAQLVGDVGRTVYFMPHYRDEGVGFAPYRFKVLFEQLTNIRNIDPQLTWYMGTIYLRDNSDGDVG